MILRKLLLMLRIIYMIFISVDATKLALQQRKTVLLWDSVSADFTESVSMFRGTAAYPSSVLMNAVPAKIAGVREIIMVTPPSKDGSPNPNIMAAAAVAGVDKVFLCGGAQAVAALAYGTEKFQRLIKL